MKTLKFKTATISLLLVITGICAKAQGYGEIRGIIKDTTLDPIPFATVKILQGNILIGGTQTDLEGRYKYKPLNPGTYDMVVIEQAHLTQPVNKIKVVPNEATYVDVKMFSNLLGTVTVTAKPYDYTKTGADVNMYTMKSLDATELLQLASGGRGEVKSMLTSVFSEAFESPNGDIHFRGTRGDATAYYVDGVKTLAPNTIPGLGIENLTVFSGGVPAMYGDVMGGVVIITTKSYFSGIREKNMRMNAYYEKIEEKKRLEKAKKAEEARLKEIEEEKLKEKEN